MRIFHPKTGKLTELPTTQSLLVGVCEKDGKIIEVNEYTHKVDWRESGISDVSYCNACGASIFHIGEFKCEDMTIRKAKVCVCGAFLGFIAGLVDNERF